MTPEDENKTPEEPGNGTEETKTKERRWRKRPTETVIEAPTLGYIPPSPTSPAPTMADPLGDTATAYLQAVDKLQTVQASGILLVTSVTEGSHGATTVGLNLAIAATRSGLRAVIIDGDESGGGPTQYLRTGTGPGLAELSAGTVSLELASRLLRIDAENRLPMIPAGSAGTEAELEAASLADPIDRISEHSDLVIIVVPVDASPQRARALAAHADGTLLVVDGREPAQEVAEAVEGLTSFGAPVIGLIELAGPRRRRRRGSGA
jgi:Mrp family chromosome partitioning ATPase